MRETGALVRHVMLSRARRTLSVCVVPGERSVFGFDVAEQLEIQPGGQELVLAVGPRRAIRTRPLPALLCGDPCEVPSICVLDRVQFATDVSENSLDVTVWQALFPHDMPESLVPLLGRVIWRKLVTAGKVQLDARVVAIDVSTGEHRAFTSMIEALKWADSTGKATIYLNEYVPEAWRLFKGVSRVQ